MIKYQGPLDPPPGWLLAEDEITDENNKKPKELEGLSGDLLSVAFVKICLNALLLINFTFAQATEVISNMVKETGWGVYLKSYNLGGWKITKSDAERMRSAGKRVLWWKAAGNISSDDENTCFYRGFESLEEFFGEWIARFIPRPGTVSNKHRYKVTGELFWSGGNWFEELIKAGYKGAKTKANPQPSIEAHSEIKTRIIILLCQDLLNVKVDALWGPKTEAACRKKEEELGMTITGKPSLELIERLYKP